MQQLDVLSDEEKEYGGWSTQTRNSVGQSECLPGVFVSVSTGFLHSCGVRDDGIIVCRGNNYYGQLDTPDLITLKT